MAGFATSVHWCYEAAFETEFPDIEATEDVITIDRNRMTASGAAAAFDLSLGLINEVLGADIATEVACWFQHPLVRGEGVTQRRPTFAAESTHDMLPPLIAQAVQMFADHIEDPLNISDVAVQHRSVWPERPVLGACGTESDRHGFTLACQRRSRNHNATQ